MLAPALMLLMVATGCTYRSINPKAALADERANNGYHELRDVEQGTAKIVLRAAGTAFPARFSVSTSPQACQEFKDVGVVAFAGRGIVYPWIANAVQRSRRTEPFIVHEAKPGEPIQVRGYGSWADGSGVGYRSGHCGPVTAKFTPQEGRAYTVDFVWGNKPECSLVIMDATDPDAPVPIPAQPVFGCLLPKS